MMQKPTGKRIVAAFVLAFLCLNVGGFLCLTYCSQFTIAASMPSSDDSHLSDHCRRAKKQAQEKDRNTAKVDANEASCEMMPVSLFAVPLEKQTRFVDVSFANPAPALNIQFFGFIAPDDRQSSLISTPVYRPPPLDRRVDRILHSVIRI